MMLVVLPNFGGDVLCNIIIFQRGYEIWSIENMVPKKPNFPSKNIRIDLLGGSI